METIQTIYQGNLRTKARHVASGNELITDAPVDNQGKGEAFSPTDLLAASLGSCLLTIMGIAARTHAIDIEGTTLAITKIMASNPRRVAEIKIDITIGGAGHTDKEKSILEHAAKTCPVALSLHPELIQSFRFFTHKKAGQQARSKTLRRKNQPMMIE